MALADCVNVRFGRSEWQYDVVLLSREMTFVDLSRHRAAKTTAFKTARRQLSRIKRITPRSSCVWTVSAAYRLSGVSVARQLLQTTELSQSISRRQLWMLVLRGRPRARCPTRPRWGRTVALRYCSWRAGAACRLEWCQLQIAARCCGSAGTIDGVAAASYNDRCLCVCVCVCVCPSTLQPASMNSQ